MSKGNIACSSDLKNGWNVCLDKISNDFEIGSPWMIVLSHYIKLKKYLVGM